MLRAVIFSDIALSLRKRRGKGKGKVRGREKNMDKIDRIGGK